MEGYDVDSSKFPSVKIPRLSTSRTPRTTSRWQGNNGAVYNQGCLLDLDLHTTANNFAPNEFREVVNPSGLVVYKGSNTSGNNNGDCNGKETKAVNSEGVNNGGNIDRGPMMFTSDVSLPKHDKTAKLGEQIIAGQLTEL